MKRTASLPDRSKYRWATALRNCGASGLVQLRSSREGSVSARPRTVLRSSSLGRRAARMVGRGLGVVSVVVSVMAAVVVVVVVVVREGLRWMRRGMR